ncbi:MAG: hypothetical protein PHZ25_03065, partial [Candidatus Pacebacteria bacterium]|nr:hypothetical protein [Candidatus Paceibacterota bacterium]
SEVRLKDLVELLSKSRMGTKGLIIIGQGNSDLFIKASPSLRREMVEEMLGLREFRLKKQEAERKLKATEFNMEKAGALLLEIVPHLRILKKQTAKWEKREEIKNELESLENEYFGSQIEKFQSEYLRVDPEMNDVERKISFEKKELKDYEEKLKKIENSRPESKERGEKLRREREILILEKNKLEKEAGGMDVRVEILEERKKEAGAKAEYGTLFSFAKNFYEKAKMVLKGGVSVIEAEKILKEAVLSFERIFSAGSENLEKEIKEAKEKKEKLKEKIKGFDEKLKVVVQEEEEVGKGLENFTEDFRKAFTLVEERRKKIAELETILGRLSLEKERWGMKITDLKEAVRQAGRNWDEFYGRGVKEKISEENLPDIERKIFRLRGELASIGEVDESLKKEAEETEERHNFLEKQLADLETAAKDLREAIIELSEKIHIEFDAAMMEINREFEKFFSLMFKGGKAKMKLAKTKKKTEDSTERGEGENLESGSTFIETEEEEIEAGIDLDLSLPKKKITGLDVLSGGERSLVSIAALFALISVSPPPFLVLDEVDAPLDERNALKFAEMVKDFSKKAQFVVVTHNRATMEMADALYGVTLGEDGASKVVSLKMTD